MPADSTDTRFRWRRHPQLRNRPVADPNATAAASLHDAHPSAARGIQLAQHERLTEAREAFAIAARDETIDLTTIPGFWTLSRAGMLEAASAYADVDRFRDAAALAAHIRTTYRPRAVTRVPLARSRRKVVAGGD